VQKLSSALFSVIPGFLFFCHSGETACVKTPKIQNRTKTFPTGMAHSAIPAQAGIQRKYSAERAHSRDDAGRRQRESLAVHLSLDPS